MKLFLTCVIFSFCCHTTLSDDACQNSQGPSGECLIEDANVNETEWKDVLLFPDGAVYSGGVVDGKQDGVGREETAEGDRYDGEWVGGVKSGAGKYKWKDGRTYKGEFRDNVPNGMGTLKTLDGASYIGMWVDGVKHGKGRYRWPSGKVYEGDWEDGLQHGFGRIYAPPTGTQSGGHVGTNGNVGAVIYEGLFYKGSPEEDHRDNANV